MLRMSQAEYDRIHPDFRGVWTTERTDIEGWENTTGNSCWNGCHATR